MWILRCLIFRFCLQEAHSIVGERSDGSECREITMQYERVIIAQNKWLLIDYYKQAININELNFSANDKESYFMKILCKLKKQESFRKWNHTSLQHCSILQKCSWFVISASYDIVSDEA